VHELKCLLVGVKKLGESDFEKLEVSVEEISCAFCEEKFHIPANLDSHVERQHQPQESESAPENSSFTSNTISCLFCTKLIRENNILTHLKTNHKNESFRCKFANCLMVFMSAKIMEEHFLEVHCAPGKNPVECKECKKWYIRKDSLRNHLKIQHPDKKRPINQNHPKFKQAKLKASKSSLTTCIFCNESGFKNNIYLHRHIKEKHKKVAVKCKIKQCRLYFTTKEQMKEHFVTKHTKVDCQFCQLSFASSKYLSSHLKKVHLEKKCAFYKCCFYTDSKEEMQTHEKEKHSKKEEACECIYCGKHFANKLGRSEHIQKFHSHISINCDIYGCRQNFFKDQADLEQHKKEAHRKKEKIREPVICLFCQKTLPDRGCYLVHITRRHSKEASKCKYRNCEKLLLRL